MLVEDDFVLPESDAILFYIAERYPEPRLLATGPRERARALQWCDFASTTLYPAYYDVYLHTQAAAPERRLAAVAEGGQKRFDRALAVLDRVLAERPFLADQFSIADIAAAAVMRARANASLTPPTRIRPSRPGTRASPGVRPGKQRWIRPRIAEFGGQSVGRFPTGASSSDGQKRPMFSPWRANDARQTSSVWKERRRRRREQQLREASRQMIEAEHALFVALRLAGHRGPSNNGQPLVLPSPCRDHRPALAHARRASGPPERAASSLIQPPPRTSSSRKNTAAWPGRHALGRLVERHLGLVALARRWPRWPDGDGCGGGSGPRSGTG